MSYKSGNFSKQYARVSAPVSFCIRFLRMLLHTHGSSRIKLDFSIQKTPCEKKEIFLPIVCVSPYSNNGAAIENDWNHDYWDEAV
jgi:hypothetical protein